jgi:uncharacterized repeat protein (TIGR03833 family)
MRKTTTGRVEVKEGMVVDINPRSDRTREILVRGTVSDILTKSKNHPHGVLVTLETGETGRVRKIVDSTQPIESDLNVAEPSPEVYIGNLEELINTGENHKIEFKTDVLWSSNFSGDDIKHHRPQSKELHEYGKATSKIIIAKSIAGLLNSDGGTLIVGVRENKDTGVNEIIGVEAEFTKLKDSTLDGYRRMIVDLIKDYFPANIFNHLNDYIEIYFEDIASIKVCAIRVKRSDKRVFLKLNNLDHFFIRTDASTRELSGEEVVDYCHKRFV